MGFRKDSPEIRVAPPFHRRTPTVATIGPPSAIYAIANHSLVKESNAIGVVEDIGDISSRGSIDAEICCLNERRLILLGEESSTGSDSRRSAQWRP